jgi:hypothetical protein
VGEPPHPLVLEAADLCPVYTVTRLVREREGARATPTPSACWRARACRAKVPVVDATNVANLELGQPTHAFDAATLRGRSPSARSAPASARGRCSRPERSTLPEGTLVIADDEKILAIAGVIGCEESQDHRRPRPGAAGVGRVRPGRGAQGGAGARAVDRQSARFERGSATPRGPRRAPAGWSRCWSRPGWTVSGRHGRHGAGGAIPGRVVRFDPTRRGGFLGVEASDAEITSRLERYGFRFGAGGTFDVRTGAPTHPERLAVRVPTWRLWDVSSWPTCTRSSRSPGLRQHAHRRCRRSTWARCRR